MTQERFFRIVDEPDLLRTITYEELKTLALAYPYAHNLRYLLAIKSRQIEHQDVVRNVATAAAYSLDRSQLFRLVAPQMIAPQEMWAEEAVLELKPIETLKRKLEEVLTSVNRSEQNSATAQESALAQTPESGIDSETEASKSPGFDFSEEIGPPVLPQIPYQTFAVWIAQFQRPALETAIAEALESPEISKLVEVREETFVAAQNDDIQSIGDEDDDGAQITPSGKTPGIAQVLAEKSVAENKDVISETLAKLYAKQGYREKAITMYERLGLAFPEKITYFAAEIDKLKK